MSPIARPPRMILVLIAFAALLAGAALFAIAHAGDRGGRVYTVAELQAALARDPVAWQGRTVLVRGTASYGPVWACQAGTSCGWRALFLWPATSWGPAVGGGVIMQYLPPATVRFRVVAVPSVGGRSSVHAVPGRLVVVTALPLPAGPEPVAPPRPPSMPMSSTRPSAGPLLFSLGQPDPILAFARRLPGLGVLLPGPQRIALFAPATYRVRLADRPPASCSLLPCSVGTLLDAAASATPYRAPILYRGAAMPVAPPPIGPAPAPAAP